MASLKVLTAVRTRAAGSEAGWPPSTGSHAPPRGRNSEVLPPVAEEEEEEGTLVRWPTRKRSLCSGCCAEGREGRERSDLKFEYG